MTMKTALVAVVEAVRVLNALRPQDGSVPRLAPHGYDEVQEQRHEARVVVEERPSHTSESDLLKSGTPSLYGAKERIPKNILTAAA